MILKWTLGVRKSHSNITSGSIVQIVLKILLGGNKKLIQYYFFILLYYPYYVFIRSTSYERKSSVP